MTIRGWEELAAFAFAVGLIVFAMARRAKTSPRRALDQPLRGRLAWLVRRRPGARLDALSKWLGATRGTAQHHLAILERVGCVTSVRDYGSTRFFPGEWDPEDPRSISVLLHENVMRLVELAGLHPDWCQQDYTAALGIRRKTFRLWADRLLQLGLLEERRHKFRLHYAVTPRLERLLPMVCKDVDEPGLPEPPPDPEAKP